MDSMRLHIRCALQHLLTKVREDMNAAEYAGIDAPYTFQDLAADLSDYHALAQLEQWHVHDYGDLEAGNGVCTCGKCGLV